MKLCKVDENNVDVLMATYNGEKYIAEQIESILNQTYKSFKLIISDDCSNDNTLEIIQHYSKLDSRIIYQTNSSNIELSKTLKS